MEESIHDLSAKYRKELNNEVRNQFRYISNWMYKSTFICKKKDSGHLSQASFENLEKFKAKLRTTYCYVKNHHLHYAKTLWPSSITEQLIVTLKISTREMATTSK